jgi:Fe-S oxidoreductase
MQTNFSLAQLADPNIAEADKILRACVHCGFCTATCPTYVLLGDELDSPRGRIYLIKEMLEHARPATADVVKHIDRCLSCLACMTTCPSGVHYMHLVDHARAYIEKTFRRPFLDRTMRALHRNAVSDTSDSPYAREELGTLATDEYRPSLARAEITNAALLQPCRKGPANLIKSAGPRENVPAMHEGRVSPLPTGHHHFGC